MNNEFQLTDIQLDRLVDGELPRAEYKQLLQQLDSHPHEWRRVGLAFLEAQAWRGDLAAAIAPPAPVVVHPPRKAPQPRNAPAEFNVPVSPPEAPQTSRFFVRPGIVLKAPSAEHYAIPHNMTFKINKDGDGPAKIVITHDGKTYETTSDKLDALPEKIRPHIERMLGGKEAGAIDLDVLVDRGPGVRLEVESKNIDETLDKWLPGAQALLKEAAAHQEQGRAIEEALRRAMVFAQRHQADARATTTAPVPAASQVESKLDEVLRKLEDVQARLKGALEAAK